MNDGQRKFRDTCSEISSGESVSTFTSVQSKHNPIILPEDENPNTQSKKFLKDLEKSKEEVEYNKERLKNLKLAAQILFEESKDPDPEKNIRKKKIFWSERLHSKAKLSDDNFIYPFCHLTTTDENVNRRAPVAEKMLIDFSRKYITSPFKLKRFIGYNAEVFAKNLTKALEFAILVTTGNLLLIYDYNIETHYSLQGHRNRVVSTSVDAKGNWIASSDTGPDSSVIIWDAIRCFPVHVIWEFNKTGCHYIKLSPCAKYLVTVVEKTENSNIKMISIWEWVHGDATPDVSVEIDTDEFGPLKKIDFCNERCEFLIVTTEKRVVFLTFEHIDLKKKFTFYNPKGLTKKSKKEIGFYNDSVYIRGTHMAISGTSTGHAVIWSDEPWNFFGPEPERTMCNKKNAFLHMQLDRYSIELIYSIDEQVVTVNSRGMILFYNQRLRVLYVIKELHGCNPPVSLSFHIKKRSIEGSVIMFENSPHSKRNSPTGLSDKMMDWEQLQKQVYCWEKPEVSFETRDFIATTNTGDVVYVNFSHDKVKYILKNHMQRVTSIDAHPQHDLLCAGTDHGKLFLYDFTKNDVSVSKFLPVVDALCNELGAINDDDKETIEVMSYITYLKYGPSGHYVACGTKSGDVWLMGGSTLDPLLRIPRATFPIVKIVFSRMNEYFAFHDSYSHMVLMNSINDPPYFIGKLRPHSKPIADMAFTSKDDMYYLYTLGLDRYFVEYVVSECDRLGFIKINVYFRLELFARGTCLFPDPSSRSTMLMFTDVGKCRFINLEKMHIYRTVQGPLLKGGLTYVEAIGLPDQTEYLLFICQNEMGLLKCPVDGNPFKWVSHSTVSEKIECATVAHHGKYVFCKGKNEYITMWEINTMPLNALEALGGSGADPFATLLSIDPRSPTLQDVQDLFFYCQVAHRGRYCEKAFISSDKIGACDVSSAFRALGFFMTDYEESLLVDELAGKSNLKLSEVEVSFDTFVQTFVNHRVCRVSEPAMKTAFCKLFNRILPATYSIDDEAPGVPIRDFLYFLETYGDKFDPCLTYIYLRSLIQPFTKEIEEELFNRIELAKEYPYIDNKYYDFMPEMITYDYFKTVILGLRKEFNEEFTLKEKPVFVAD